MRWPSACLAASSALLLAGCGGGERAQPRAPQPKLPRAVAQQLAARADRVAERIDASDRCGALAEANQLQSEVIQAINTHRVPSRLQEPLQSSTNALLQRIGRCVPAPPANGHGHKDKKKEKDERD